MLVRSLRPVDLVALARFQNGVGDGEITAHTWPRVPPESARLPFLNVVSEIVAARMAGRRAWVARGDDGIVGLVVARARSRGLAWDIEHLHALPGEINAACQLLEHAFDHGVRHGVRRVFLETLSGALPPDIARRTGFERYTQSTLYVLSEPGRLVGEDGFAARPRKGADDLAVFQLYNASVPANVRLAEAMTREEWQGLAPAGARRPGVVGRTRRQYVWDLGAHLVGWMELRVAERSQYIELLVHPKYEESSDHLLRRAVQLARPNLPLYLSIREYQPALASALTGLGGEPVEDHDVFVHLLAQPVRETSLLPAQIARA
jgi:hypothetical protein